VGKIDNLNVFGSKKTKGPKQEGLHRRVYTGGSKQEGLNRRVYTGGSTQEGLNRRV